MRNTQLSDHLALTIKYFDRYVQYNERLKNVKNFISFILGIYSSDGYDININVASKPIAVLVDLKFYANRQIHLLKKQYIQGDLRP